jgi:cytochrome bd-type quinol oxidase subunit 1
VPDVQEKRNVSKEMGLMSVIFKYIGFGLMFVFLGIIGVVVMLYYLVKKLLEPDYELEIETDD